MKDTFDTYDADGSGFLDKKEFTSFANDLLDIVSDLSDVSKYDILEGKDQKEWLSSEFEVQSSCLYCAVFCYLSCCVQAMDSNHDGKISFLEFNEYIWNTYKITFASGATTSKYHGVAKMTKKPDHLQ